MPDSESINEQLLEQLGLDSGKLSSRVELNVGSNASRDPLAGKMPAPRMLQSISPIYLPAEVKSDRIDRYIAVINRLKDLDPNEMHLI